MRFWPTLQSIATFSFRLDASAAVDRSIDVLLVVDDRFHVGCDGEQRHQALDLEPPDDFGGDQDVLDAAADQHVGFTELGGAQTLGARRQLQLADRRRLVRLPVGPEGDRPPLHVARQRLKVALEDVEVDEQRRRRQILEALPQEAAIVRRDEGVVTALIAPRRLPPIARSRS